MARQVGEEHAWQEGRLAQHAHSNAGAHRFLPETARFVALPVLAFLWMPKIGEILISEGHLTAESLQEALDWQVLYGGRLGTNLLELRLVEEAHLARALGKQLGAEVTWGNLEVDPALVPVIPPHVADRQEIVPWKLEKRRLKVLCCEI